jgi:NAD(P)-dependent dehydrogenase (short-subunit alcohol dehydrogenase family)
VYLRLVSETPDMTASTNPEPIQSPLGFDSTAAEVTDGIDLSGSRAIVTGGSSGIGIETARALSAAGAEVTLAVRNTDAGDARIVSLSSAGHRRSPVIFDDINFSSRPYDPGSAYGQSKTANVLFAVEATRRWASDGITANAVQPGPVAATNLNRNLDADALAAVTSATPELPPLMIQAGSREILLDDATRLASRAAAADVAVRLEITPGVPHVFQGFAAMLDEGDAALTSAGEFLRAHLAGQRP